MPAIRTEVDVSLGKDGCILAGKADLLLGGDGKLELLRFKNSQRPHRRHASPLTKAKVRRDTLEGARDLGGRVARIARKLKAQRQSSCMVLPYPQEADAEMIATR